METNSNEEIINPNEFTQKELTKLLFREMKGLRDDFEKYQDKDELVKSDLKSRVEKLETWRTESSTEKKTKVDFAKWIGWLFAAGLGLLELYQLISQSGGL